VDRVGTDPRSVQSKIVLWLLLEILADCFCRPRSAANVECKRCNEKGHFAKVSLRGYLPLRYQRLTDFFRIVLKGVEVVEHAITVERVSHFVEECLEAPGTFPMKDQANFQSFSEGHRKGDCTNPRKIVCRNCDEEGHESRECPKPRDYSRVKCSNCQQSNQPLVLYRKYSTNSL
jgi:hypothetical protein